MPLDISSRSESVSANPPFRKAQPQPSPSLSTTFATKSALSRHQRLHKARSVDAAKEAAIYRALGLPFIEPELREGRGEIERALKRKLPKLVTTMTCTASCTVTRTPPTARKRWREWQR
jgi:hypothetical protein